MQLIHADNLRYTSVWTPQPSGFLLNKQSVSLHYGGGGERHDGDERPFQAALQNTSDETSKREKRLVNDGCGQRDAAEAVFPGLDGIFCTGKREDLKMALKRSPSFPNTVCFHSTFTGFGE